LEAIDLLIDHGADIDVQNADGRTALMLAAQVGDEELIDYLLDYGADKLIKDNTGMIDDSAEFKVAD
jgi:ankyrin repeat protein